MRRIFTAIRPSGRSFQSTHPARGATPGVFCSKGGAGISIHAPREGCDGITAVYEELEQVFQSTHPARGATGRTEQASKTDEISIHAPREGCDRTRPDCNRTADISIHAPREGCDSDVLAQALPGREFQSTHPARGATRQWQTTSTQGSYFNPRTPRGVRQIRGGRHLARRPISIHAPREGCDSASAPSTAQSGHFNPRTPRGVRPGPTATAVVVAAISIHAPREGCDYKREGVPCFDYEISIHAPREGCDFHRFAICTYLHHFNPRTPRGVRRSGLCLYHRGNRYFNPRTPRGVRLQNQRRICYHGQISIHAPREGCDAGVLLPCLGCRGISIHAPREGCDAKKERYIWFTPLFQSTHPARGATSGLCVYIPLRLFQSTHPARGATRAALAGHPHADISIHAPREGCDSGHHAPHPQDTRFQSTHPARGATASCHAHL